LKKQFRGINNPVICYIGKISFSPYLWHFGIIHWLEMVGYFQQTQSWGDFG